MMFAGVNLNLLSLFIYSVQKWKQRKADCPGVET